MLRLFSQHRIRPCFSLDGVWKFRPADSTCAPPQEPEGEPILVPSCWEMLPGFESWRGKAWISRSISCLEHQHFIRLVFGGASHTAHVWLNGRKLGSHTDAYTPFAFIARNPNRPRQILSVLVDNTFDGESALHSPNDYYTYGGITRPVELQHPPACHLASLRLTPRRLQSAWALDLRLEILNLGESPFEGAVAILADDIEIHHFAGLRLPQGTSVLEASIPMADAPAWEPQSPALCMVEARLMDAAGKPHDDLIERTGFREVRVEGGKILLNGRALALQGVNRHEDHAIFGCSLPPAAMAHDLALIRSLGLNFVRTSHYPNDQRFLDLCDESGVLVWEESHARQVPFERPRAREQLVASTREMLAWHHNHPSIIVWGCLNECCTFEAESIAVHHELLELIRRTDPSRPATYAGCYQRRDQCLAFADVVSHNIYTGWYEGGLADMRPMLEKWLEWVDSPESGGAGKPVIISEFGAGAVHGFRAPPLVKHTEDYQARLVSEGVRIYGNHPRLSGFCIWQFADCRVSEEGGWWLERPRHLNDKGLFTRSREAKAVVSLLRTMKTGNSTPALM